VPFVACRDISDEITGIRRVLFGRAPWATRSRARDAVMGDLI